jgi:hypothetical protein
MNDKELLEWYHNLDSETMSIKARRANNQYFMAMVMRAENLIKEQRATQ